MSETRAKHPPRGEEARLDDATQETDLRVARAGGPPRPDTGDEPQHGGT